MVGEYILGHLALQSGQSSISCNQIDLPHEEAREMGVPLNRLMGLTQARVNSQLADISCTEWCLSM